MSRRNGTNPRALGTNPRARKNKKDRAAPAPQKPAGGGADEAADRDEKPVREPVSKTLRFEVFKRDKFTCQYCGAKAPDVVLHADHIKPVAGGGKSDILNLVTACVDCNSGKGARRLDDSSVVERQRAQLEELQERREQLEMLLAWRDGLEAIKADEVSVVAKRFEQRAKYGPNENGQSDIRRWLRQYGLAEILAAVDEACDVYLRWQGDEPTDVSWETAFKRIPGICNVRRQSVEKPWLQRLFYIQGILRRRFRTPRTDYITALDEIMQSSQAPVEDMEECAKRATDWEDFQDRFWAATTAYWAGKNGED